MTYTDPIADMIIRLKNAGMVKKESVQIPFSSFKENVLKVLKEEGYIKKLESIDKDGKKSLKVFLLYDSEGNPVIENVKKVSTPGLRTYVPYKNIPNVKSGYGLTILSTSKGICTGKKAKELGIGGEVLFYIL